MGTQQLQNLKNLISDTKYVSKINKQNKKGKKTTGRKKYKISDEQINNNNINRSNDTLEKM